MIIALFAGTVGTFAQVKKPTDPPVKAPFAASLQAVVVSTKDWNATTGTATRFERASLRSKWEQKGDPMSVVIGRSGLAWAKDSAPERVTEFKKEGDGKAPAGLFPLTSVFGSSTKPEYLQFPFIKLESATECVDDTASGHYNKIVNRNQVGNFDWKSSEKMLEYGEEYGLGVFVAFNSYPVVSGDGSCIFLHVWKDSSTPTSGCTAMNRIDLERIVSWIDNEKNPYLVQLPASELKRFRKKWNLPKM